MKTTIIVLLTGIAVVVSLMAANHSSIIVTGWYTLIAVAILSLAYFFPFPKDYTTASLFVRTGIKAWVDLWLLFGSLNYLIQYFSISTTDYIRIIDLVAVSIYFLGIYISYQRSRQVTSTSEI